MERGKIILKWSMNSRLIKVLKKKKRRKKRKKKKSFLGSIPLNVH